MTPDQTVAPMSDEALARLKMSVFGHLGMAGNGGHLWALNMAEAATLLARLDAAEARAIPAPRLIRTLEDARALPAGTYFVRPEVASEGWFAVEALDPTRGARWLYLDPYDLRRDHMVQGCWVVRVPEIAIPDLPIPTTTEGAP